MINFEDFNKKLTIEQFDYIKKLAELEFYAKRSDYHLCQHKDGNYEFIHEQFLDESIKLLDDEKDDYFDSLLKKKITHPPLTPIELQLKKTLMNHFKTVDSELENKRDISETLISHDEGHADYYSESLFEKIFRYKFLLLILILFASYLIFMFLTNDTFTGTLKFITSKQITNVHYNNNALNVSKNTITFHKRGLVSFDVYTKDGAHYKVQQNFIDEDTAKIEIKESMMVAKTELKKRSPEFTDSYIKFKTNMRGFTALIDQSIISEKDQYGWIEISKGDHVFEIFKEGYISQPPFRSFYVRDKDSIEIIFTLKKETKQITVFNASLTISSNIEGAQIWINGSNTGYKTPHTFQFMKEGIYQVSVQMNGYKNDPGNKTILISKSKINYSQNFNLKKSSGYITVKTTNASGDIFIDGKKVGKGSFVKQLNSGQYTLSFGSVPGFHTPDPIRINLKNITETFQVAYYPKIEYTLDVRSTGIVSRDFNVKLGYSRFDFFKADTEKGPNLESRNGKSYYELKHPFPYNNPTAGQALKLNFELPSTYNYQQPLYMYLYMGYTNESYDITGKIDPLISLFINNKNKLLNQKLDLKAEDAARGKFVKYKINELLKNGQNEMIIYVSDKNTVVTHFYKMELRKE